MPKKTSRSKKKEFVDPDTGEVKIIGHHHTHRSRGGETKRGEDNLKTRGVKARRRTQLPDRDTEGKTIPFANPNRQRRRPQFRNK